MTWRLRTQYGPDCASIAAAVCLALAGIACGAKPLSADPESVAAAPPELSRQLRADPYTYFRFINQEWTARVCEVFARDLPNEPRVQLHGDAHIEQYAIMNGDFGLDDFDDSARGPALVDVVRFLGSVDLVAEARGWSADRERLFDRFFAGYRRGLAEPKYVPPEPEIVTRVREESFVPGVETFLASAEAMMEPMDEIPTKGMVAAMKVFADLVHQERPELPVEFFRIERAGWLRAGVGSAIARKVLMRVRGPSDDPADDVVLEAKASRRLNDIPCLELPTSSPTFRVVAGAKQVGRLKHSIIVAGPEVALPELAIQGRHLRDWWIRSWDRSYREIALDDLRSVEDLAAIVFDSGVQLGAGTLHRPQAGVDASLRDRLNAETDRLEPRLRATAVELVQEMLVAWREFSGKR